MSGPNWRSITGNEIARRKQIIKRNQITKEGIITEDLRIELEKQLYQIEEYINLAEKRLKKSKGIERQAVCTSTRRSGFQYYLKQDGKRNYVKTEDMDIVRKIVQKNYDEAIYHELLTMRYRIERFIKLYNPKSVEQIYHKLADARKNLIVPLILTDEQYIKEWYGNHHGFQNTFPKQGAYLTNRGEEVRSKSEKIIADIFNKYGIP